MGGSSLSERGNWLATVFACGTRPEQRALLGAAAEVYDLVGALPEGREALLERGLDPDAARLVTIEHLRECLRAGAEGVPVLGSAVVQEG